MCGLHAPIHLFTEAVPNLITKPAPVRTYKIGRAYNNVIYTPNDIRLNYEYPGTISVARFPPQQDLSRSLSFFIFSELFNKTGHLTVNAGAAITVCIIIIFKTHVLTPIHHSCT